MVVAALLALVLAPRLAHADCAAGPHYTLTAGGNIVTVCERDEAALCTPYTQPSTFLRQDEASGEVVSIAATCDPMGCFNDECVPPGTYRYGLASPFPCSAGGCPVIIPYFEEVTVTAALSSCTRDPTSPAPMATTMTPPWVRGTNIVASMTCPGCGCGTVGSDRDKVLAVDFLVAAVGLAAVIARRRPPHRT
jgi:MYXO-CTERM domain-containing protein